MSTGTKGFKYGGARLPAGGLKQLRLMTRNGGRAKITARGQGSALALSGLGFGPSTIVSTELRNVATGACFGARYPSPFRIDAPNRFQDTSD